MKKLHVPAVAVLALLALSPAGGAWPTHPVDAHELALELRDAGLPLDTIETEAVERDRLEVTASGPGLRLTIASFDSAALYREWEGMLRRGPGGRSAAGPRVGPDGPEQVSVFVKEPYVVVAVWALDDEERATQVRGALASFEEIGGPEPGSEPVASRAAARQRG